MMIKLPSFLFACVWIKICCIESSDTPFPPPSMQHMYNPFAVLSPHDNQYLVGNSIFAIIQFNETVFELGKHGSLCVHVDYGHNTDVNACYASMRDSVLLPTKGVFSMLLHITEDDSITKLNITFTATALDGHTLHTESRTVHIVTPFLDTTGEPNPLVKVISAAATTGSTTTTDRISSNGKSIQSNSCNSNAHGDYCNIDSSGSSSSSSTTIVIADSTLLMASEYEILRMRIEEHSSDVLILDDTNQYFDHTQKPFVMPPPGVSTTKNSTMSDASQMHGQHEEQREAGVEVGGGGSVYGSGGVYAVSSAALLETIGGESDSDSSSRGTTTTTTLPRPSPMSVVINRRDMLRHVTHTATTTPPLLDTCMGDLEARGRDSLASSVHWMMNHPLHQQQHDQQHDQQDQYSDHRSKDPPQVEPDLYIISDADEILKADTITVLKRDTVYLMNLRHHVLKWNWVLAMAFGLTALEFALVVPASLVNVMQACSDATSGGGSSSGVTASSVRRMFRAEHIHTLLYVVQRYNIVIWNDAGWHLSSFRNASAESVIRGSVEYLYKTNSTLWSEDTCQTLQEIGVPHYLISGGGQAEDIMTKWPLFVPTTELTTTTNTTEYNRKDIISGSTDRTSNNDIYKQQCNIPKLACRDHTLYMRHEAAAEIEPTERENRLRQLLAKQGRLNRVVYHAPKEAGRWFDIGCLSISTDSNSGGSLRPDRQQILELLFCDMCPYRNEDGAVALVYDYLSQQCSLLSAPGSVQLHVIDA